MAGASVLDVAFVVRRPPRVKKASASLPGSISEEGGDAASVADSAFDEEETEALGPRLMRLADVQLAKGVTLHTALRTPPMTAALRAHAARQVCGV